MNNVYYRFVRLASHQDRAKLPAMLRMNVTAGPGVPRIGSDLWSAVPTFVRRSRYAVLLAASVIASPAFTQEKTRDPATFLSGHLTATGQFQNYLDGSTRGVRVDIYGSPDGDAFKLVEDTAYSDGEKHHWVWRFSKSQTRYVAGATASLARRWSRRVEIRSRSLIAPMSPPRMANPRPEFQGNLCVHAVRDG